MDDEQYRAARNKVIGRLGLRATFVLNLLFFLTIFLLILRDAPVGDDAVVAAMFSVIWFGILLIHGGIVFNLFGGLIDRAARRELEQATRLAEKPKRHALELGEDGELVEIVEDWGDSEQMKRGNSG
ncbi:MAG: hypothetical protein K8I60_14215 [Anaerolineae bacterium]|nr:hypothetical protein [Anaerolineae bacterium]